jgi:hypothetical protein
VLPVGGSESGISTLPFSQQAHAFLAELYWILGLGDVAREHLEEALFLHFAET